jgi:hypothetical protein
MNRQPDAGKKDAEEIEMAFGRWLGSLFPAHARRAIKSTTAAFETSCRVKSLFHTQQASNLLWVDLVLSTGTVAV